VAQEYGQNFSSLDILVNNAGNGGIWDFTDQTNPDVWWKTWEVNVKGTWLVTKYFLPLLLKSELRTVVLFTSIASVMVAAGGTSYPISKFAVSRMAEVFATEYEKEGLMAIAFNPGDVPTDMSRKLPGKATLISQDKPELAGDTLVFLTKEKRQWLSGRMITSNWDMEEFLSKRDQIVADNLLKFCFNV
jgi:NAD(P)-dependent dehydrogenase (short-subunit alcohol dehydrogenase family)